MRNAMAFLWGIPPGVRVVGTAAFESVWASCDRIHSEDTIMRTLTFSLKLADDSNVSRFQF